MRTLVFPSHLLTPKLPSTLPLPSQDCLLQRLLRCLPSCPEALLTEVTTLLLLLLYDAQFKFECTVHLLDQYDDLLGCIMDAPGPGKHPLTTALDRLTVQLFNCEEVTLRWV